MNMLSILIYSADVLSNISTYLFFIGSIILVAVIITAVCISVSNGERASSRSHEQERYDPSYKASKKTLKYLAIPLLLLFMANLMPSQNTVYLIAASELAEEGYKSEVGQKLTTIVNEKLDEYLTELSSKPVSETVGKMDFDKLSQEDKDYLLKKLGVK